MKKLVHTDNIKFKECNVKMLRERLLEEKKVWSDLIYKFKKIILTYTYKL